MNKAYIHLRVIGTVKRMRGQYMALIAVGIFFIILGIAGIVMGISTLTYYSQSSQKEFPIILVGSGCGCIFIGIGALKMSVPAFIPIKQQNTLPVRSCPYCGAVVEENATYCDKCHKQLD